MKMRKNHKTGEVSIVMDYTALTALDMGLRELKHSWEKDADNAQVQNAKDFYNSLANGLDERIKEIHDASEWAYYHTTPTS